MKTYSTITKSLRHATLSLNASLLESHSANIYRDPSGRSIDENIVCAMRGSSSRDTRWCDDLWSPKLNSCLTLSPSYYVYYQSSMSPCVSSSDNNDYIIIAISPLTAFADPSILKTCCITNEFFLCMNMLFMYGVFCFAEEVALVLPPIMFIWLASYFWPYLTIVACQEQRIKRFSRWWWRPSAYAKSLTVSTGDRTVWATHWRHTKKNCQICLYLHLWVPLFKIYPLWHSKWIEVGLKWESCWFFGLDVVEGLHGFQMLKIT